MTLEQQRAWHTLKNAALYVGVTRIAPYFTPDEKHAAYEAESILDAAAELLRAESAFYDTLVWGLGR